MKYAFFGTPRFAAFILEKLVAAGMEPSLVVCNPDKPVGRKKIVSPPPTKVLAEKYGIPVWQPEILDENFKLKLLNLKLDFMVVAAYAKILKKEIIEATRLGAIGVHPSLLPKYRGTTPIQNAILQGDAETGTTLFLLDEKVDHGAILASAKLSLTNSETYKDLEEKLARLSGDLLVRILPQFATGAIDPVTQNEAEATFTKKFKTEDGFVDLTKEDDTTLDRKIRALNPEPGVYTMVNGTRVKILDRGMIQNEGKRAQKVKESISYLKALSRSSQAPRA